MRNKITYNNIHNDDIILEDEKTYSKRNISEKVFENIFLKKLTDHVVYKEYITGLSFYSVLIDGHKIKISFQNLRNSGTKENDNKRFQIGNKLPINSEDNNSWFFGSYNTENKILFVLTEDIDFAKKVKDIKSLSSIWINFDGLIDCYKYGKSVWNNNKGRKYYCFDSNLFDDKSVIDYIKNILVQSAKSSIRLKKTEEYELFDEKTHVMTQTDKISLVRDSELRKKAVIKAGFKCEICKTDTTFVDKNGEMYFEGHHLIPYNYNNQKKFKYLLDTLDNIACLCPNCHKKIHLTDKKTQVDMIITLAQSRTKLFKNFNIIGFNDIIKLYDNK